MTLGRASLREGKTQNRRRSARAWAPMLVLLFLVKAGLASAAGPERFFAGEPAMSVGTYYYPEQWPEKDWDRDLGRIAALGFEFTHYAEFAWSSIEPTEAHFDFQWLDKAIELAGKHHLRVILCTPSAAPPVWLTSQHPEVLMVDETGTTLRHGARQQGSWSSPLYRQYVDKIVTQLAKRYGNNPVVWGWQIDNEPSHYRTDYDYNADAQQNFRQWLRTKYVTVQALNKSWGTAFWSQDYNDFAQIRIPNQHETSEHPNPHAMLDFRRFTADEVASFVADQSATLRRYVASRQWITTNLQADALAVDPRRVKSLDFPTFTKYLVAGFADGTGDQGFRMGSSSSMGYSSDYFRPIAGITGVMELQPGQVNWGVTNPQPIPGAVRLWIFHAFLGGNRFVANYRFREPLSGIEQYHNGIMQPDGTSIARSGQEYVQAIGELKQLQRGLDFKAAPPHEYAARRAAILSSADNRWNTDYQPQTDQWNYGRHVDRYYRGLQRLGAPIDVIGEDTSFDRYPVVIAPAYQLLDGALVARWQHYVENGGHLVLTPRTGQKDREGHLWEARLAEPIRSLIGAKDFYYDTLPDNKMGRVSFGAFKFEWNNWADVMEPSDAEVWATYDDQFYRGKAAVLHRRIGKGSVTYIGVDSDDGKFEAAVLQRVYKEASIPMLDLPEGVVVGWRDGVWIALNYSSDTQVVPIQGSAALLLGSRNLMPAGIAIWKP